MTMNDFQKSIDPQILERGYKYYKSNRVVGLNDISEDEWEAEVHGSDVYHVNVGFLDKKITKLECDCPYGGNVCKHVVAVLFSISDENKGKKGSTTRKSKGQVIQEIFNKTGKAELQKFLTYSFSNYKGLSNAFVTHFAELIDQEPEEKYRGIVKTIIRSGTDRYGFIDYRSAKDVIRSLSKILEKADELQKTKRIMDSFAICKIMIEELPTMVNNMDDSDGGFYGLIDFAFNIFSNIIDAAPPQLKDNLFKYCISEYQKDKFQQYDLHEYFLNTAKKLITTPEQQSEYLKILDIQIEKQRGIEYGEYKIQSLIQEKIDFLFELKRDEEAWNYIERNINYPEIRQRVIDREFKLKNYNNIIKLCADGITIAKNRGHYGTVRQFEEILLTVYEKTKKTDEFRSLASRMFFDSQYGMKYYKILKSSYNDEEWISVCNDIIEKIKGKDQRGNYGMADILAKIFVEENFKERLLKLLQINPTRIFFTDEYASYLRVDYPDEVLRLYEFGIKKHAEVADRRVYNEVAGFLKNMKKIKGGEERIQSIISYLLEKYKNRRAMKEVLSKLFRF